LFLGILVKRSAFALGFLLVWNIIEGIINGVLTLKYSQIVKLLQQLHSFTDAIHVELIVEPFTRLSKKT
jgi:hypothetical protein